MLLNRLVRALVGLGVLCGCVAADTVEGQLKIRVHTRGSKALPSPSPRYMEYNVSADKDLPLQRVHIVTAVGPKPCKTLIGGYLNMLALKNYEDFAASRPEQFTFQWHMGILDPDLPGMWNKIAILRHMFDEMEPNENEWLMWMDLDALILNTKYQIPFEWYKGRDLLVWRGTGHCKVDNTMHGWASVSVNALAIVPAMFFGLHLLCLGLGAMLVRSTINVGAAGINAGVLLFRNTAWSRYFLSELSELAKPAWRPGGENYHLLESMFDNYDPSYYEQAAISYLWLTRPEFAEKSSCGQPWTWLEFGEIHTGVPEWKAEYLENNDTYPFIVHWAGCQFCSPTFGAYSKEVCAKAFMDVYAAASLQLHETLHNDLPWGEWGLDSGELTEKLWANRTTRKLIELDTQSSVSMPLQ